MSASPRWQRTHELFDAALRLPAAERDAFLSRACGDDVALRTEVEALLRHDSAAADDFLDPASIESPLAAELVNGTPAEKEPAPLSPLASEDASDNLTRWSEAVSPRLGLPSHSAQDAADVMPDPHIGRRIGPYAVKSVIARGGMATVYEAAQHNPDRVVALKIMNRDVPSRSALRRFELESQVLARLRHQYVAQVYSAGIHRDDRGEIAYFAMEYFAGARAITEYVAYRILSVRERLELFVKVCDAVHHGHQKGIIHRDLKPANILVDSGGDPKVIDFGVARVTDSDLASTTLQTRVGQLIGTLQYMSPEQCDFESYDLDIRTDVYALGIVLYELLTGEKPYDASTTTIYKAIHIIKTQAPRAPRELVRNLHRDLELIVLKTLEKDRERRYASAADLARDLRHHLAREPIEARRPSPLGRVARWLIRHPVVATSAACIAVAGGLVGGAVATVAYLRQLPSYVRVLPSGRAAELRSRIDEVIHRWETADDDGICFAGFARPSYGVPARHVAVVGFRPPLDEPYRRELCVFDADNPASAPLWVGRMREADRVCFEDPGCKPAHFLLQCGLVADVFPELPGDEIVASFEHHSGAASILRVYDLTGVVRCELWVRAPIKHLYWSTAARQLLIVGPWTGAFWSQRGMDFPGAKAVHPMVVFAVRPALGEFADSLLPEQPAGPAANPLWLKALYPARRPFGMRMRVTVIPPAGADSNSIARVEVSFYLRSGESLGGIGWDVDRNGERVPGTFRVPKPYIDAQAESPDELAPGSEFELRPLPPISRSDPPGD